jgi:hypothetical protein
MPIDARKTRLPYKLDLGPSVDPSIKNIRPL